MESGIIWCLCAGADFIASAVVGILASLFFGSRYGLDAKAKREMMIMLIVFTTPLRALIYGILLLLFAIIFNLIEKA